MLDWFIFRALVVTRYRGERNLKLSLIVKIVNFFVSFRICNHFVNKFFYSLFLPFWSDIIIPSWAWPKLSFEKFKAHLWCLLLHFNQKENSPPFGKDLLFVQIRILRLKLYYPPQLIILKLFCAFCGTMRKSDNPRAFIWNPSLPSHFTWIFVTWKLHASLFGIFWPVKQSGFRAADITARKLISGNAVARKSIYSYICNS